MDTVRLILILVSITITIGPTSYGLIIYRDNLTGLLIPSEAPEFLDVFSEEQPEATVVESGYNASARTAYVKINITNPYKFALEINSLSADVECNAHHFHLGRATSEESKTIPPQSTTSLTVEVTWTQEAVNHVQNIHPDSTNILIDLTNIAVNVQGIELKLGTRTTLPDPIPIN